MSIYGREVPPCQFPRWKEASRFLEQMKIIVLFGGAWNWRDFLDHAKNPWKNSGDVPI